MKRIVRESVHSLYGMGLRTARERAEENAKDALDAELADGFDLVPCPNCGWYQSRMVSAARNNKYPRLTTVWVACAGLGVFAGVVAIGTVVNTQVKGTKLDEFQQLTTIAWAVSGTVLLALAVILFAASWWLREPNLNKTSVEHRLARARTRGAVVVEPPSGLGGSSVEEPLDSLS